MALSRGLVETTVTVEKFGVLNKLFGSQFWGLSSFSRSRYLSVNFTRKLVHLSQITLNEVQQLPTNNHKGSTIEEMATTNVAERVSPVPKALHPARMRKPSGVISPPIRKGMMTLDKNAFDKDIKVPAVYVYEDTLTPQTLQKFKKFMLKIRNMKPVSEVVPLTSSTTVTDKKTPSEGVEETVRKIKRILINPELLKGQDFANFVQHEIQPDPATVSSVGYETVKFTYDNWTLPQVMDAILPDDDDKVSGFSQIGHIIHVNLRDHTLPFKSMIGQVMLEKIPNAKTVVNKINVIESKYRNFQMELLAGDPNTVVTVKENRCEFEFDFATVYWNPRLSSEHDRLIKLIQPGEVLYDVFAGVGPFVIPAAKKKIMVVANDLNPDSFKWLQHNVKKNKVSDFVKCFNLDGRVFINESSSLDLQTRLTAKPNESTSEQQRFHFVMNLPALAVDFLDAFWGILEKPMDNKLVDNCTILVHVYCFIKDVEGFKEKAVQLVKDRLGYDLQEENIVEVVFVRNVAPNKEMLRVSFSVPSVVLVGKKEQSISSKRKFCEIDENSG